MSHLADDNVYVFYQRDVVSGVFATATWLAWSLARWVAACHSLYCIKTTKPILKLFRPSGSPIIEAFGNPCADTKFQAEPLQRGS